MWDLVSREHWPLRRLLPAGSLPLPLDIKLDGKGHWRNFHCSWCSEEKKCPHPQDTEEDDEDVPFRSLLRRWQEPEDLRPEGGHTQAISNAFPQIPCLCSAGNSGNTQTSEALLETLLPGGCHCCHYYELPLEFAL